MSNKETRSSRYHDKPIKKTNKKISAVLGTSLAFSPLITAVPTNEVHANGLETQGADTERAFIDSIGYAASSVANSNDLYASVMIAQALLESNFGNSGLASSPNYNLFGIKGSDADDSVYMQTNEYINGEWVTVTEPFKRYSSYSESFADHVAILKSTINSSGNYHYFNVWKSNTTSYLDATAALAGTYATDPEYTSKLNWLIENYGLTAYDFQNDSTIGTTYSESENGRFHSINSQSYTVVSGDTLWDIAQRVGMSVDELMALNNLSADLITVGQVLYTG